MFSSRVANYVTGSTVDDDLYCVAFAMHAARVLLMLTL